MAFRGPAAALLLVLSACEAERAPVDTTLPEEKAAAAKAPAVSTAAPKATPEEPSRFPCLGTACRVVTPDGWAGIRAGMKVATAMEASGFSLEQPGQYDEYFADEPETLKACNIHGVVGAPDNLSVFVQHGVITSVGVEEGEGDGGVRFETDRGVGLGDPEAAVRRAYPRLDEEPDIYSEPPDKKLFFKSSNGNGIKFSINGGRVSAIDVGGSSIGYVEGCL